MPEKRFVNRSVFLAELLRHAVERVLRLQGGMGVGVVWIGASKFMQRSSSRGVGFGVR